MSNVSNSERLKNIVCKQIMNNWQIVAYSFVQFQIVWASKFILTFLIWLLHCLRKNIFNKRLAITREEISVLDLQIYHHSNRRTQVKKIRRLLVIDLLVEQLSLADHVY